MSCNRSQCLAFDEAKLSWELDFFLEHYFHSLRGETLRHAEAAELKAELNDIAAELSAAPRFFVIVIFTAPISWLTRQIR